MSIDPSRYRVPGGKPIDLADWDTRADVIGPTAKVTRHSYAAEPTSFTRCRRRSTPTTGMRCC